MLKWAVYSKKNQDAKATKEIEAEEEDQLTNALFTNKQIRRSLDAPSVKKSKKPSRYQRRSIGSTARKNNIKYTDKENINYIGNTPNYFKEGFVKKAEGIALKDVSNITPTSTTPVKNFDRRKCYINGSKDDIPPTNLPPTPPTYSRRVREAKKRKLEMTSINKSVETTFVRNNCVSRSERRVIVTPETSATLSHSNSEPSLNDLEDKLSDSIACQRNSIVIAKKIKAQPISTTQTASEGLVEIEYDKDLVINCIEKPVSKRNIATTTLPIFGHHIFMDNPLYFNKNESACMRPIKRTRKKSSEFESSFKSPSVDKKDTHSLVREACSPVTMTPLSLKLSALRFSTMSTHSKTQRDRCNPEQIESFPKIENPFVLSLKDEESAAEMENKFILTKDSVTNVSETTVSTTQMGDVTLERMIDDIIKSTKIVKTRRRINHSESSINVEAPTLEAKELFISSHAHHKTNIIKEAKYVNLSRENSVSPKSTPSKKMNPVLRVNDKLLKNLPIGCFILDDGDGYNEREVRTPNSIEMKQKSRKDRRARVLSRSQSMNASSVVNGNTDKVDLDCFSSGSTPDSFSAVLEDPNTRLKRQRCIRRKKSTVSNESYRLRPRETKSILTLEIGIPSPATALQDVSISHPLSSSIVCLNDPDEPDEFVSRLPKRSSSLKSNVSHSSLKSQVFINDNNVRSRELFGLTLENGIPSPITPVNSLKRSIGNDSDDRAHKTSKLDDEFIMSDRFTPVIEHKSTRRCLTFSPEEGSISSNEEKRSSVASNPLEQSSDRFQALKGTIDLEIITKDDVIDVHVIRCRDLQRSSGKMDDINAYAKVVISGLPESQSLPSQRSIFQRTSVLYGRREPEFQRHLKLPLPAAVYEHQTLHISVWHRDKKYRRSEFLGCVSFPLKDAVKGDVSGTYFLQSAQGTVRTASTPAHTETRDKYTETRDRYTETRDRCGASRVKMATDNVDGSSTNEDTKENHVEKGVSNGTASLASTVNQGTSMATALQKEADEHLFLRYLELDPPVDETAPQKRPQRNGRTPFTTTRKLSRAPTGGFGFTVVWTRPPRVERVAAGGSAERAGLRAGDYIVFVGNKNVVQSGEEEVRNLVKTAGQTLTMETFRRASAPNGATPRLRAPPPSPHAQPLPSVAPTAAPASPAPAARPPTACSSTSQSLDRRKLHLPQVTFSKETPGLTSDGRRRALMAVVAREQHFATNLQFGLVRFVSPLAERADLISASDHQLLFQNLEEILRLSEDILDQVVQEDSDIQTSTVVAVYLQKTSVILSLYKKYCLGLKRADCVLVKKSKDPSGAFSRFCTSPPIPRRRPDITSLVHKPLEQFRELLRLMRAAAASNSSGPYDIEKKQLQVIAEQLQNGYQDVTAGSGLMGLAGDGKPLLSVTDLESRLVFTRCKPFVLSTPGRQWIFGGELSRIEGRAIRPYWALLFSDLLLFATVSRDRVLFVTEEPVALSTVSEANFTIRKKATEFRLILGRTGGDSPLVSCAPRTPGRRVTIVLRAPSIDLKAVWQSLLQRQIYRAHTVSGTPLGSPLDSPDPQLTFSLATLDSQQRQVSAPSQRHSSLALLPASSYRSHLNMLVEERSEKVEVRTRRSSVETQTGGGGSATEGARSTRSKGSTLHLQRWMTQLPESEEMDPPEPDMETWSVEELRKRSKELNLIDLAELVTINGDVNAIPSDKKENEKSPSKSSNSGSQITVRTSPVVVDTIPVCRQCHKKCLSKPNSPLVSQKDPPAPGKLKIEISPQNSNKSSLSASSTNCSKHKSKFCDHLERKGAMKLRPEDVPKAALKVIDSIEQSQKMLKSTSYDLNTESPVLSRSASRSPHNKSQLELRNNFMRSPSPSSGSRNNSPLSTSHTTCSSMVFNSSSNDLRISNSNIANQVQCVIAQEKYINEVKCVENITLTKAKGYSNYNLSSPNSARREQITRQKAEKVLNKVLGMNIITKRENVGTCLKTSSVFLEDDNILDDDHDFKVESRMRRSPRMGISAVSKMNGDVKRKTEDINVNTKNGEASDEDLELGPLMLMGLSAINPATHLMRVDPFKRSMNNSDNGPNVRPGSLCSVKSESHVPNIAVVPPTPDFNTTNKTDDLIDDSPDSPDLPDEPPYVTLKRYGTLSSLERFPSDETDDGNVRVTAPEPDDTTKTYTPAVVGPSGPGQMGATGGIMGWTARAGSFVVEKMNIFSYTESGPTTVIALKQPSFLERCLGVSDWKSTLTEEGTGETGEGSGASGEDAWGTPSSGDLSDNQPDSEHGTLSSPTKSSSSYAGDDDTELMMDELLMAPTITGPTTLRPLLPRRRLEPLLEEEFSESGSDDNKPTPTNPDDQGSEPGLYADGCCDAPPRPPSASLSGTKGGGADGAQPLVQGGGSVGAELSASPERTPTNETPSMLLQSVSKECAEGQSAAVGAGGRRGSVSSASTPSTLERTTIYNPSPPPADTSSVSTGAKERVTEPPKVETPPEERLSPRAEMRLALDQGKDMLADQEASWAGASDPWSFRAACQRSLLRRVSSADAVTLHLPPARPSRPAHRTAPHTTSRSSVYAWKAPESEKPMEMEQLARAEAQTTRSQTPSQCQNGKILGFLRRRASSDSPRREPLFGSPRPFSPREPLFATPRPFSPRRTTVSNNGYYKICFVNGYV